MAVIAKFTYEIKPGRMQDFITKLVKARSAEFTSAVMPKSVRLFQSTVPGPETRYAIVLVEYEDMAAYGARTAFEQGKVLATSPLRLRKAVWKVVNWSPRRARHSLARANWPGRDSRACQMFISSAECGMRSAELTGGLVD